MFSVNDVLKRKNGEDLYIFVQVGGSKYQLCSLSNYDVNRCSNDPVRVKDTNRITNQEFNGMIGIWRPDVFIKIGKLSDIKFVEPPVYINDIKPGEKFTVKGCNDEVWMKVDQKGHLISRDCNVISVESGKFGLVDTQELERVND